MALTTVVRLAVRGNAVVPVVTFRWILLVLSISCSAACGGETRVEACDARILSGPVARGAYYMSNFAIDTCNAYGIDATAGALWRESITGGDRVTLGASASTGFAQSAMANSTHAFWNDGGLKRVPLICRIDTLDELDYFKNGGILQYVLRHLAA